MSGRTESSGIGSEQAKAAMAGRLQYSEARYQPQRCKYLPPQVTGDRCLPHITFKLLFKTHQSDTVGSQSRLPCSRCVLFSQCNRACLFTYHINDSVYFQQWC